MSDTGEPGVFNVLLRDVLPLPYLVLDGEGVVVSVNTALCEELGLPRAALEGYHLSRLPAWSASPAETASFLDEVRRSQGRVVHRRVRLLTPAGEAMPAQLSARTAFRDVVVVLIAPADGAGEPRDAEGDREALQTFRQALDTARSVVPTAGEEPDRGRSWQAMTLGRLGAMLAVTDVLLVRGGLGVSLAAIVRAVGSHLGMGRGSLAATGPSVDFDVKHGLLFSLILHDVLGIVGASPEGGEPRPIRMVWTRNGSTAGPERLSIAWQALGGAPEGAERDLAFAQQLAAAAFGGRLQIGPSKGSMECEMTAPLGIGLRTRD